MHPRGRGWPRKRKAIEAGLVMAQLMADGMRRVLLRSSDPVLSGLHKRFDKRGEYDEESHEDKTAHRRGPAGYIRRRPNEDSSALSPRLPGRPRMPVANGGTKPLRLAIFRGDVPRQLNCCFIGCTGMRTGRIGRGLLVDSAAGRELQSVGERAGTLS